MCLQESEVTPKETSNMEYFSEATERQRTFHKRYSNSRSQVVLLSAHASRQASHSSGINTECDLALSSGLDYTANLARLGQKPISPRKRINKPLTSVRIRMPVSK